MVDVWDGPPREGTRGGLEQFRWDSVKNEDMRDRECYLGQSVRIGMQGKFGKFSTHDWWRKQRGDKERRPVEEEVAEVKRFEEELMQEALGLKPRQRLTRNRDGDSLETVPAPLEETQVPIAPDQNSKREKKQKKQKRSDSSDKFGSAKGHERGCHSQSRSEDKNVKKRRRRREEPKHVGSDSSSPRHSARTAPLVVRRCSSSPRDSQQNSSTVPRHRSPVACRGRKHKEPKRRRSESNSSQRSTNNGRRKSCSPVPRSGRCRIDASKQKYETSRGRSESRSPRRSTKGEPIVRRSVSSERSRHQAAPVCKHRSRKRDRRSESNSPQRSTNNGRRKSCSPVPRRGRSRIDSSKQKYETSRGRSESSSPRRSPKGEPIVRRSLSSERSRHQTAPVCKHRSPKRYLKGIRQRGRGDYSRSANLVNRRVRDRSSESDRRSHSPDVAPPYASRNKSPNHRRQKSRHG